MSAPATLGTPFACIERRAIDTFDDLGAYVVAVNDPPWSSIAQSVRPPASIVDA